MDQYLEFVSNNMLLVTALVASFFLLVFTELRRKAVGMVNVDPNAAVRLINNDAVVLDLRNADAFGRGHIVGARNVPLDELDAKIDKLDRAKPVVAVCDAGMSSGKAVDRLRKAGFESAWGIKGGMNAWSQEGLPVVTGKKTKAKARNKGKKKGDKKQKQAS
ncbi:MAG: rhodanese-like domain-containing protein [Pseudomonadota bacterium]